MAETAVMNVELDQEAERFARNMMNFVENSYRRPPSIIRNRILSDYEEMGEAVVNFQKYFETFIDQVISSIVKRIEEEEITLEEFAQILVSNFWEDYPFLELIMTCSIITRMIIVFYNMKNLDTGCKMIAFCYQKLKPAFIAEGGWPNFKIYCDVYGSSLEKISSIRSRLLT